MAEPLHPLVVHFPIALLFAGAIIGIVAVFLRRRDLHIVTLWFLIPGWLGAAVASATGDDLGEKLRQVPGMRAAIHAHELYAYATMALFAVAIVWLLAQVRFAPGLASKLSVVYVLVLVLGLGSLFLTGKYGGDMVWGSGAPAHGQIVPLNGNGSAVPGSQFRGGRRRTPNNPPTVNTTPTATEF